MGNQLRESSSGERILSVLFEHMGRSRYDKRTAVCATSDPVSRVVFVIAAVRLMRNVFAASARLHHRISEWVWETSYGVRTSGFARPADVNVRDSDANEYAPSPYRVTKRLIRELPAKARDGAFIDYGCGRGRVVVVAASFPFRRVIGVELSSELSNEARENVVRCRIARRAPVEIVTANASTYMIDDDVTTVYLYNPFRAATLHQVLNQLADSLQRCRRDMWIVACHPKHFEAARTPRLRLKQVACGIVRHPTVAWSVFHVFGVAVPHVVDQFGSGG